MTMDWMWQLFSHEKEVVDIFISRKMRRSSKSPFAFVRVAQREEALEAIKQLHGMEIRGCKIAVSLAEYK